MKTILPQIGTNQKLQRKLIQLLLAINIAVAISSLGLWFIAAAQGLLWRADFTAFYTAWAMVRDGLGTQLYNLDVQRSYQLALLEGDSFASGLLAFNYPPQTALIFSFLSFLELADAYLLWSLFQMGLLLWLVKMLLDLSDNWKRHERCLLILLVVAFPPLMETFLKGTFSLFILCCLVAFYHSLVHNNPAYSGLWLVIASLKPQSLVLPGIILLASRRWKAIAYGALGALTIFLAISILWGARVWQDFIRLLSISSAQPDWPGIVYTDMYNIRGLLVTLLGVDHFSLVSVSSLVIFIISILGTLWIWSGDRKIIQSQFELRFALTLTLGLFTSLHLNSHDSLQAVLPATLLYNHLRTKPNSKFGFGIFVLSAPIIFFVSSFASVWGNVLPTLYLIMLFLWSAWELHHAKEKS